MASTRDIRIPADSILALGRSLRREVGVATAAQALRDAGNAAGDAIYERLERGSEEGDLGTTPRTSFWQRLADIFRELGWGSVEHRELHPGVGALVARDWFEVEPDAPRSACHFTTGVLANVLGRVAGSDVAVLAVPCGESDRRCVRFLFGGGAALQEVYERMRDGRELDAVIGSLG